MSINLKETIVSLKETSYKASKAMDNINTKIAAINLDNSVAGVLVNDKAQAQKMKNIYSE